MAFKVHCVGVAAREFDDEHHWKTIEDGMLEVTKPDKSRLIYSPSYWTYIEVGPPEAPQVWSIS